MLDGHVDKASVFFGVEGGGWEGIGVYHLNTYIKLASL